MQTYCVVHRWKQ